MDQEGIMFKRITKKLKALNDEAEKRIILIKAIRRCGIHISHRESTRNMESMFIKLMEMNKKPYYDGVIEQLMLRNLRAD